MLGRLFADRSNYWFPRILLVNLLLSVTMNGMRPMVSYRALALDASPTEIGLITAGFGILAMLIAVPAGRWVDRLGEAPFMAAGTAVIAAVAVLLYVSDNLALLAVAMLLLGAGQIVVAVGLQTLVANGGSTDGRDTRFGTQTVVASLGQLIGPAVAGLIVAGAMQSSGVVGTPSVGATNGVFVLGAVTGILSSLVAVSLWRWPPGKHARRDIASPPADVSTRAAVARVFRVPSLPQAMFASLAVLATIDILVVYLPVYGSENRIPVETIGLLLAVRGLGSMGCRALLLPLRRLLGRQRLLIASMLVPAVMLALIPFLGSSLPLLFLAVLLTGAGLGLGQPLTMTWVAAQAPVDIRATAIGVRLSGNRLGQFAVPVLAGLLAGAGGVAVIFWSLGALLGASSLLVTRTAFDAPTPVPQTVLEPETTA